MTTELPVLPAAMSFQEACAAVIAYLKTAIPMGYWAVNRFDGDRQIYLTVADDAYGSQTGDSHAWTDSLCQYMVTGQGPHVAPDAMAVPVFANSGAAQTMPIGSYLGFPIQRPDGQLFGTLCGLDPAIKSRELEAHAPLLDLLSQLLATVLDSDLLRTKTARALELTELEAETDALTGLYNRRGWDRFLATEEVRFREFGEPASVIVVDLDRLKVINDTLGHRAGDEYITKSARALRDSVRGADMVARLGGDEFGIVAAGATREACQHLLSRLRRAFERAGVSGSFGSASHSFALGLTGAWESADRAMYAEKAHRRLRRVG